MSIPWGDVATAYYTTGIPDIESYTGMKRKVYNFLKFQFLFNWLLRTKFVRNIILKKIKQRPAGPNDEQRSNAMSLIWGEATDAERKKSAARMRSPDGYTLSAYACLIITKKILAENFKPGFQTPGLAYGEDLVLEIPDVQREEI
jgi:short subunit dehydrogenase-like uncharacterized protein